METELILSIVTILLGAITTYAGKHWATATTAAATASTKLAQTSALLTTVIEAVQDNAVTEDECQAIIAATKKIATIT